jgi:hypothetical protein
MDHPMVILCDHCDRRLTYTAGGWEETRPFGGNPLVCERNPIHGGIYHEPSPINVDLVVKSLLLINELTT